MLFCVPLLSGCAAGAERELRRDLVRVEASFSTSSAQERPPADFRGPLREYVTYARQHSPALRQTFEKWRAALARVPQARRLPEPMLDYGNFVQSVETRVGPQRQRFGISQSFPWPTKLTSGAGAAALAAQSAEREFEAESLTLAREVADAYWRLWLLEWTREIDEALREVLKQAQATTLALLEAGGATLGDFEQIGLSISRIEDSLAGIAEDERAARAALVAVVGAPGGTAVQVQREAPEVRLPDESEEALLAAALTHPRVRAPALMANARQEQARAAAADRYPGVTLGAQYIQIDAIPGSSAPDNGKDAIVATVGLKLPLWQGVYAAEIEQATAESAAYRAREAALRDLTRAELVGALSAVRDAARRVLLYRGQLIPQAAAVYDSTLAGFRVGSMSVASVLMAERDLLDLRLGLRQAMARWAQSWSRLEEVVGRGVESRPAVGDQGR